MSGLVAEAPDPRAVIVAIHGGGTSAAYFDCPGHPRLSLLRSAASRGYTAIAIDRPGYGASELYQAETATPEQRVALALGAVDKIAPPEQRGAGVFLLAHSAGCELAMRMAVDDRGTDVLGVELAGTGLTFQAGAKAVLTQSVTANRPAGLRDLLWQPTDLYPPEVLTGGLSAPRAAYEGGTPSNWAERDFPAVASRSGCRSSSALPNTKASGRFRLPPRPTSRHCSRGRPASWSTTWRAPGTISASALPRRPTTSTCCRSSTNA